MRAAASLWLYWYTPRQAGVGASRCTHGPDAAEPAGATAGMPMRRSHGTARPGTKEGRTSKTSPSVSRAMTAYSDACQWASSRAPRSRKDGRLVVSGLPSPSASPQSATQVRKRASASWSGSGMTTRDAMSKPDTRAGKGGSAAASDDDSAIAGGIPTSACTTGPLVPPLCLSCAMVVILVDAMVLSMVSLTKVVGGKYANDS
mmetsp:Transcript_5535/g.17957  ORF Transcript_5535/g.17957 Transcript_5535/m.17957 type:complete len:203 (+) Transcript_5535:1868-2476(+)